MIGEPKFKQEDQVTFTITRDGTPTKYDGVIYIVDAYGTFGQTEEPSYDIEALKDGEITLFKHIRESLVTERISN